MPFGWLKLNLSCNFLKISQFIKLQYFFKVAQLLSIKFQSTRWHHFSYNIYTRENNNKNNI